MIIYEQNHSSMLISPETLNVRRKTRFWIAAKKKNPFLKVEKGATLTTAVRL